MQFQISPSKLNVARCGRALELMINKVPRDTPEFENTLYGSELHNVLHEINVYQGMLDDLALDDIINKCCTHQFEAQRRLALKYINGFPYHSIAMSELECGLDEHLKPAPFDTALYRGRIDAIIMEDEHTMIIVDHKSSYQTFSPDTEQLRFYAWIIARTYPYIERFVLSIYFIRYGEWKRTDFSLGKAAIANIERAMMVAAQVAWNQQLGLAVPGKYCTFCPYAMSCPEAEKSVNVITSETEAREMAQKLHVMQKQSKEYQQLLQNYARENGFIPIDGNFGYGYSESEHQEADVKDVLNIARTNPDALSALKVDIKQLKRLKIDIPITTRYSSRWGAHAVK